MKAFFERLIPRVFGFDLRRLSQTNKIVLWVGVFFLAVNLLNTAYDFRNYSGTDQRHRIVAARCLLTGINPYKPNQLKYSESLPETLQEPDHFYTGLGFTAYPPTLLIFWVPLSQLPYRFQRACYMVLEWTAMILVIALCARLLSNERHRFYFVVFALIGFTGSHFWRLHVERGQYHIYLTLLLTLGTYLTYKKKKDITAGIPFGLFLAIRPTLAVLFLVLAVFKKWKIIFSGILTAALLFSATLSFNGFSLWGDWLGIMDRKIRLASGEKLDGVEFVSDFKKRKPAEKFFPYRWLPSRSINSSFLNLVKMFNKRIGLNLSPENLRYVADITVSFFLLLIIFLFLFAHKKNTGNMLFGIGVGLYLNATAEFGSPYRWGYADTQFLPLIAISLPFLRTEGFDRWVIFFFLLALFSPLSSIFSFITVDLPRTVFYFTGITVFFVGHLVSRFDRFYPNKQPN